MIRALRPQFGQECVQLDYRPATIMMVPSMGVQLYVALLPAMLMLGAPRPADQTGSLTPTEMSCAGDCDQNGKVEIHELIVAVNIALGSAAVEQCRLIDTSGDGEATVDELIRAVREARNNLVDLEDAADEELETFQVQFQHLREKVTAGEKNMNKAIRENKK